MLWDAPWITNAQITQVLKLCYGRHLGNYQRKHILKQDIPPTCNLCPSQQNDMCLHLLSCCNNKHINNPRINRHSKAVHTLANMLLYPPHNKMLHTNQCEDNNRTPENTMLHGYSHVQVTYRYVIAHPISNEIYYAYLVPCQCHPLHPTQLSKYKSLNLHIIMIDSP
jgi:hypothetical protein